MMRSMYTGVAGLVSHQTKMDVIANNMANVNTAGYKSNRASFSDVLSQTMKTAQGVDEASGRGGINPMQVGLGVKIAAIDKMMTQGATQTTNSALDAMIQGDGFFIVGQSEGDYLTRAGNFNFDSAGFMNLNGYKVFGWDARLNETTKEFEVDRTTNALTPIRKTAEKETISAASTTMVDFEGNLNAETHEDFQSSMSVYDSKGNTYSVPLTFEYDEANSVWRYGITRDSSGKNSIFKDGDPNTPIHLGFSGTKDDQTDYEHLGAVSFDKNGKITSLVPLVSSDTGSAASLKPPANVPEGNIQAELFINKRDNSNMDPEATFGNDGSVILDFTNLTQFAASSTAKAVPKDGNTSGKLDGVSIGADGTVIGTYTNGKSRPLAQLALADIPNKRGLEAIGNDLFTATANSGGYNAETNGFNTKVGDVRSSALEMSNVELSNEFTEMITTQRGFQANSKVISTADEMLKTATSMKK